MDNFELFDDQDLVDVKKTFVVSEEEKKQRKEDKNETILDVNSLIKKNEEKVVEEEPEEELEEIIEKSDIEEELTEENVVLQEQFDSLKNIGALFLPDDYKFESLEKALEDSNLYRNQSAVNTVFNKIPDVEIPGLGNSKDLFVYLYEHEGKDLEKFKKTFGHDSFNPSNFDLQKEQDRRKVLELFYAKKGFNENKTKKFVDKIFDDFEDETEATEALGELVKIDQLDKQNHLQELEKEKEKRKDEAIKAYNHQLDILKSNDFIGGYPFSKEEKSKALNSLYSSVNNGGVETTDFNYRLENVVLKNPELTLALSAFLNTLSKDNKGNIFFDLSKFERKEKTKVTRNLKEDLNRLSSGKTKLLSSNEDNYKSKGFNWDKVVDFEDLV